MAAAKIHIWLSIIRNAWLIKVNDIDITSLKDVHEAINEAVLRQTKHIDSSSLTLK